MFFGRNFSFFLIFITLCAWGVSTAAPLRLHDENRVLSATQTRYLEKLAKELKQKTGFSLSVVLLEDSRNKRDFSPDSNEVLLYTAFVQHLHHVQLGKNLESFLPKSTIEKLQQEYLFPEYMSARYDKGTLLLAYHLSNELANAKGKTLVTEPPEFESAGSLNAAGWVFVAIIFSLVFYALYKRGRRTSAGSTSRRFHYGRFGWR
jgi:uncharacterized membrane protein YgcG